MGLPTPLCLSSQLDLSATLLDGRAGNGWARLLRCGRNRSGGGFPNAGYEPHPSCGNCPLTSRSRPKRAAKISRKIVVGQQYTKRIRELTAGRFIANAEVVLLLGPPGVGKTHLAVAIGRRAIAAGYTVLFVPAPTRAEPDRRRR